MVQGIRLVNPGYFTTIQDIGRFGFQQYGVPVSGAMDELAFRIGNTLVGNPQNTPSIEFSYGGLRIEFRFDAHISITGGNIKTTTIGGRTIPCWETVYVEKGTEIIISDMRDCCRGYLSVAGGLKVPQIMGSSSTYLRGKIGGYNGQFLKANDTILFRKIKTKPLMKRVPKSLIHKWYLPDTPIRVIMDPRKDAFTCENIQKFLNSEYFVTNESDRMGYRLSGPVIKHKGRADIISEGIALGTIQIPGSGLPIILLADRHTVGGYAKIATIITVDIPRACQRPVGSSMRFIDVPVNEAHELLKEFDTDINLL